MEVATDEAFKQSEYSSLYSYWESVIIEVEVACSLAQGICTAAFKDFGSSRCTAL